MSLSARHRSLRARAWIAGALSLSTVAVLLVVFVAGSQADTPPTVLLGTADQFAVLAGSGITNTGVTTISGDTGSTPTESETGFAACPAADCVAQTGANHTDPDPNDAATQSAQAALTTAYNDAAGRTPTQVLTELGGQRLVGGVYNSASGTFALDGTLILDGQNNADEVFIFQTGSTLIAGTSANISLIRGAQACNVFWQVGSAATLGASSTLVGTVMAHDDISLDDSVTVNGRLLAGEQASHAGAVTLIHDTITRPSTCLTQAEVNAAAQAAAAQAAAAQAAAAQAAAAQAAATQAAAAAAAATAAQAVAAQAAVAAAAQAAATAAATAAQAAAAATAAAAKATAAAATAAAKAKATHIAAVAAAKVKAAAAARAARAHAQAARAAAAKAARSAKAARTAAAVKAARAARALAAQRAARAARAAPGARVGHAQAATHHVGFTG